jgi:hypothetical protein
MHDAMSNILLLPVVRCSLVDSCWCALCRAFYALGYVAASGGCWHNCGAISVLAKLDLMVHTDAAVIAARLMLAVRLARCAARPDAA